MEPQDVLSDQMYVARPECVELFVIFEKPDACKVIGQGIEPDVNDMPLVGRDLDPPAKAGPADRKIAQAAFYETRYLVIPDIGHNKIRVLFKKIEQGFGVF